jgi:hypothetical protein
LFPQISADASLRSLIGNNFFYIALAASVILLGLTLLYLNKKLASGPQLNITYEQQHESVSS